MTQVTRENSARPEQETTYCRLPAITRRAIEQARVENIDDLVESARAADTLCRGWDNPRMMFEVETRLVSYHCRKRARELARDDQ